MPRSLNPIYELTFTTMAEPGIWDHYEQCVRNHDWTYEYSDDHSIWVAGNKERDYIDAFRTHLQELDRSRADLLFYKYCPWLNDDGTRNVEW